VLQQCCSSVAVVLQCVAMHGRLVVCTSLVCDTHSHRVETQIQPLKVDHIRLSNCRIEKWLMVDS